LFTLLVVGLLVFYWIVPAEKFSFSIVDNQNSNFSVNSSASEEMQFYPNMRYQSSNISYRIDSRMCTLQKLSDIKTALGTVGNLTVLNFYPVDSNEELSVTCSSEVVVNKDFFVAGEGGPVNITKTDNFNVIFNGKVLLLRDSKCATPNVAIHEVLHALGFKHSGNPNNIMYEITDCGQVIGDDIPKLINELYAAPAEPDLAFDDVSANIEGRRLNANISIRNNGLQKSGDAKLVIYADGKKIKEEDIAPIGVGYGLKIFFTNVFVADLNVEEIEFEIQAPFSELEKNNNRIRLK
jgi:hypothetical protein